MPKCRLTPLHVHSHFSLLEGVDAPTTLLRRAADCGYPALALTDSNNLYGAVAFVEAARQHGVRPLLGACLRRSPHRCTVLIAEPAGYANLCRILSRLHLQEQAPLPQLLRENAAGLHVLVDDIDMAASLREAFGPRLWLEIVRPRRSLRHETNLLAWGQQHGLKPVASTAAYFAQPEGQAIFRLLVAVRRGMLFEQLPTRLPISRDHHLVDAETFYHRFRDLPEAIVNMEHLAEQCSSDVLPRGLTLPPPPLPAGQDAVSYLRQLCERGLRQRTWDDATAARQRLERELYIIAQRDLAGYFLVVHDIAQEARRHDYPMALRGSAGNSLVCYLLGITDVDPLRFALPLERFLHAGRSDLPDIDLDFDWKIRDQVIASVFARYGAAYTAMISSHLFLQPRSAFREAAKVHGLSNAQIAQLLETLAERVETLGQAPKPLARVPRSFPLEPERWPRLLADARRLLGRPHHLSIHPGGIVITPRPIENYIPLQRAAKDVIITQFEKDAVEEIGLVKIDLLGNRALATLAEARRHVAELRKGEAPAESPDGGAAARQEPRPPDDPAVLDLLRRGDTLGINQLESPAMRHLIVQLQPRGVHDIIQALALIRPGAGAEGAKELFVRRRRGLEPIRYPHPSLEPMLRDTCGLMLYEDDNLGVLQALAGLSAPEADRLRKQTAKAETPEQTAALRQTFLTACARNGVARPVAEEVWGQLTKFTRYSFCKSHAVSYGLIAWEAAALKAHYPRCFWTAALNNNQGMYPRWVYVEAARRAGISFFRPCVNRSQRAFSLEGDGIRTGLTAIRSLDEATREALLQERQRHGPFQDLADFRRRVAAGPEALALLIQVGAFDFTQRSRSALMLEAALEEAAPAAALFRPPAGSDPWPYAWRPADYPLARQWQEEWERLGFLVEEPLMKLFRPFVPTDLHDSRDLPARLGRSIRLAGLVAAARHTTTKHGEEMQFVTLQDEWGFVDATLFPNVSPPTAYLGIGPYVVEGTVEEQYGVLTVTATRWEKV